jgi:predicted dehydrogenase
MTQALNRRDLLRLSAAASLTAASANRAMGANERIRAGIIGLGRRAVKLQSFLAARRDVEIVAICDIWDRRTREFQAKVPAARAYREHRKLLESPDIDVVFIATPDHWHSPMAIDAANAGKDIYVEKPLTRRMTEGPAVVRAIRLNKRVCQVGTQQRSGGHYLEACERYVNSGKLGKITIVRTFWYDNGNSSVKGAHAPLPGTENKPEDLDWDRFLGNVAWRDWDPKQYFNFRAYLDFGGGKLTDDFVHLVDTVHHFMGQDNPIAASAIGGIYTLLDGRTAPDTISGVLQYPGQYLVTFEHSNVPSPTEPAVQFFGTEGRLYISRDDYSFYPPEKNAPASVVVKAAHEQEIDHLENFLACCRSRKQPNCDVHAGHRSAQAAHLLNLSYVQQRRIRFDPDTEQVLS